MFGSLCPISSLVLLRDNLMLLQVVPIPSYSSEWWKNTRQTEFHELLLTIALRVPREKKCLRQVEINVESKQTGDPGTLPWTVAWQHLALICLEMPLGT